ncbi:MAG: glycoside hydrolase [Calditrichaeota bacterium]|nr:MAG: glycoside hydrolase [Calditrichota bacterium]
MPTLPSRHSPLWEQAGTILNANWRGGYTVPSAEQYPFQWNWDAGFIALGRFHLNREEAFQELRSLFKGQWKNGLLPHILFHEQNEAYFPGPEIWQSRCSPYAPEIPTSGIIQPPVVGFVLEAMYDRAEDPHPVLAFTEEIFPQMIAFHRYLYTHRDPRQEGLVYIRHNWESGTDNSPTWDAPLGRIRIETPLDLASLRRDLHHVDAAQRPPDEEYQRYLYLVQLFVRCGYDEAAIYRECPFLIQEPLINGLLVRSNQALIRLGEQIGASVSEVRDWNRATIEAMNRKLWNPRTRFYDAWDLVADAPIEVASSSGIVPPLFAGVPDARRAAEMVRTLETTLSPRDYYLCPSFSPLQETFEPQRYWRGPVWINMNWMLYHGLLRYGFDDLAQRVLADTLELLEWYGFYEYFDPRRDHGAGYGAKNFSWSAALALDLLQTSSP